MKKDELITGLFNEDGTSLDDIPKNTLKEKWENEVLTINSRNEKCSPSITSNSPNYNCVLCNSEKCYHSKNFIIPEEDIEACEKYKNDIIEYHKIHNPKLYEAVYN